MLRDANQLAARGWPVFPIQPAGKTPLTRHGFKDATTEPDRIRSWWARWPDANIGVATGGAAGIYVIDLDGPTGVHGWKQIVAAHWPAPRTLIAQTGGGGFHLIYTAHGLPNTAGRLAPNIDTRGDGGYIVAPPSLHPSGRRYEWVNHHPPAPLPEWARNLIRPPRRELPRPEARQAHHDTRYGLAALRNQLDRIAGAAEGTRNHTLNQAAFAAGQLIAGGELTPNGVTDLLEQAASAAGLPTGEARQTIRSGLTAGMREPWSAPPREPASTRTRPVRFGPVRPRTTRPRTWA